MAGSSLSDEAEDSEAVLVSVDRDGLLKVCCDGLPSSLLLIMLALPLSFDDLMRFVLVAVAMMAGLALELVVANEDSKLSMVA